MNHTATEIRDGKDLLGQPVHFPGNAEKLRGAARFSRTSPSLKQLRQLKSILSQLQLEEGWVLAECGVKAPKLSPS